MTPEDVEAIAQRVVELLGRPVTSRMVDAAALATELGVSVDYVYAHAPELGAMRLGGGPKARLRFDVEQARRALEARSEPKRPLGRPRKNRLGAGY